MALDDINKKRMHPVKAAILGGMAGAAVLGVKSGFEKAQINSHILSPAAITELQEQSGATDSEISALEERLKDLMHQELKRLRERD